MGSGPDFWRPDCGEGHRVGIGVLKTIVAVVVFAERGSDTVRIISARKATRNEEAIYRNEI